MYLTQTRQSPCKDPSVSVLEFCLFIEICSSMEPLEKRLDWKEKKLNTLLFSPYVSTRLCWNNVIHCSLFCTSLNIYVITILQFIEMSWTALHCTALHCTALHCTALHCTALHCTALYLVSLHKYGSFPGWTQPSPFLTRSWQRKGNVGVQSSDILKSS